MTKRFIIKKMKNTRGVTAIPPDPTAPVAQPHLCVFVIVLALLVSRFLVLSSSIMEHELFWSVWPIVSNWLLDQLMEAISQRRLRRLRRAVFDAWREEIPPELISDSD